MELKQRTPEEREAYLLDQIVNLQSQLAAKDAMLAAAEANKSEMYTLVRDVIFASSSLLCLMEERASPEELRQRAKRAGDLMQILGTMIGNPGPDDKYSTAGWLEPTQQPTQGE